MGVSKNCKVFCSSTLVSLNLINFVKIFQKFIVEFGPFRDLAEQENPECLGLVWGLYGKLDIHPDVCQRLVLVRRCDRVGEIPGPRLRRHAIYRVGDVVLLPLVPPNLVPGDVPLSQQLGLKACPKHHGGVYYSISVTQCGK